MRFNQILGLVGVAVLIGANVLCLNLLLRDFRAVRIDLTEGRQFTLANETRELLHEPEEPLEIWFFHSSIDKLHEKLQPVLGTLSDTLREFEAASDGHVTTHIVEWDTADKAIQERATNTFGVNPVPIPVQTSDEDSIRNTYFSIVVSYGDQVERFDLEQLHRIVQTGSSDFRVELLNIEYIVAKAIHKVVRGFQSVGAALATKDLTGSITFYFSPPEAFPKHLEKLHTYAAKVAKKLSDEALGRLKIETIDPTGDTPEKQQLRAQLRADYGVREIPIDFEGKTTFYSWAVLRVGETIVPLPMITRGEEITEAEVKEMVEGTLKLVIPGFLTPVGVSTPDAAENPMSRMMGQREPPAEFREIVGVLAQEFDVKEVKLSEGKPIPREIAVLLLVRPADLSDKALYEIDQFVMRGGRLVVCADPFAFDMEKVMSSRDATGAVKAVPLGKLKDMLRSYGADIEETMILDTKHDFAHYPRPRKSGKRDIAEYESVKQPYFVYIEAPDGFDQKHPITSKQRALRPNWAAPVSLAKAEPAAESRPAKPGVPAGVTGTELARTSPESSTSSEMMRATLAFEPGYRYRPPPDARSYSIAVALQGVFPSFFADKPIPGEEARKPESAPASETSNGEDGHGTKLLKSRETSVVVIGDSDFISPVVAQVYRMRDEVFRENFAFLRNAIDFGGPDAKLMPIRSRERVQRPLTKLRSLDPDERQKSQEVAKLLALIAPTAALVVFGGVWTALRLSRRPIDLPTIDRKGGDS